MRRRLIGLIAGFLRGPWTPLRLTGVTFGLMILVVAATGGQRFYTYTQDDPTFCRSCHTMEKAWTKWQTSEHSKITCHSCHESSPFESMEQVVKYALNRPNEVRKHAGIDDEACEKCHMSNDKRWKQIENTAGHLVHVEEQRIACTKCHAVTTHSFAAPSKVCLSCHGEKTVKMTKMAERYCLDCHNYLAENSPLKPTRQTCLDCHQKQARAEVHWPSNAPMQFQCSQCHKPHEQIAVDVNCQNCHATIRQSGLHGKLTHSSVECKTCHEPHEWKVTERATCVACHQTKLTHNQGRSCDSCHDFHGQQPASPAQAPAS
jgi:nitrate/TMAO reductase-like tetraheme cytochrome c subunit